MVSIGVLLFCFKKTFWWGGEGGGVVLCGLIFKILFKLRNSFTTLTLVLKSSTFNKTIRTFSASSNIDSISLEVLIII